MQRRHHRRRDETRGRMAHRLYLAVLYVGALCDAVPLNDLLDRASQHSDNLHSLSTLLTHQLDTDFPFIARAKMPRPSKCHTSSLHTPNDKEQALLVSESELLSLARSLLQAWADPLVVLGGTAGSLPHPAHTSISSRVQELQDHSRSLGDGLEVLSARMGPSSQVISFLPYTGSGDLELGQDRNTRLAKFHFLLSCFRRDSHKIDSFLKVLRCRATKMRPDMC